MKQDENKIWVSETNIKPSYPDEGNQEIYKIEDKSFWFNHRNNIILSVINRYPFINNFADIGGGNGYQIRAISNNYPNKKCFLIEPGYQGCLNAINRGVKNVYNIPFNEFDFNSNQVGAIGLFDVLEHIKEDADFINQIKLKLPKNSLIYITVPAHNYLWSDSDDYGGHFKRYNSSSVKKISRETNTELLYFSYFFTYVPFITFVLKRIPYLIRGKRDSVKIINSEKNSLSPGKTITAFFNYFHSIETNVIKKRKLLHGGSCIFVLKT